MELIIIIIIDETFLVADSQDLDISCTVRANIMHIYYFSRLEQVAVEVNGHASATSNNNSFYTLLYM